MPRKKPAPSKGPQTFTLTLTKTAERGLSRENINKQLHKIKARALGGNRQARGWRCRVKLHEHKPTGRGLPYHYTAGFHFTCRPRRARQPSSISKEWDHIVRVATTAGNGSLWLPEAVEGQKVQEADERIAQPEKLELAEYDIPDNWPDWFAGHVYDRDDQLAILTEVLQEAKESGYRNRFNAILEGSAGSGKTEIIRQLKKHLPPDCWLEFDCTQTTAAGAIEELRTRARMPTIIFLEEAEKARHEDDKSWLLAATDSRSEIRKVVFRRSVHKEVQFVCICTVNDIDKLNREFSNALGSRFPYQLHCPHPDERTMRKILEREIRARPTFQEEDLRWIEPALALAGELDETDPRQVKAWCLTGKDKLLDGTWQQRIKATRRPR
jgi:hypothetical protein